MKFLYVLVVIALAATQAFGVYVPPTTGPSTSDGDDISCDLPILGATQDSDISCDFPVVGPSNDRISVLL